MMTSARSMKTISIITCCFNEEGNVHELYERVRNAVRKAGDYEYEHIFIDNCSSDATVDELKRIAATDPRVRIIVNARNFGPIRSSMHALNQATGDAVIGIVADLQDPPELISQMLALWESGYAMVLGIKKTSQENPLMFLGPPDLLSSHRKVVFDRDVREFYRFRVVRRQSCRSRQGDERPVPPIFAV